MKTLRGTFLAAAAVAGWAGCGGAAHLSESFGQRTRATLAAQRVAAEPDKGSPAGLDSEEAAIIHGAYRKSLGAAPSRSDDSGVGTRVLVVEEPKGAPRR